jgi:hypothetical protein
MERLLQRPEVARLIPEVDLKARVVYFPVRHHSPACAWHVDRLIREIRPAAVLIEGPRDATRLIPFLLHKRARMPVAIYTTFVQRREDDIPLRHAAYYPLCDYSPELAAVRAADAIGAEARFIDLTFPEMVLAEQTPHDEHARSLFEERYLTHSRLLRAACRRSGARDPDDLWDHLYEVDHVHVATPAFMRNVLAYCALARHDYTPEMLTAEGCTAREAAMAAAVADTKGKVIVVTGGFHTVALPQAKPAMPPAVKVVGEDAQVVLMRYGFEQLDRLNGYASGMPAPEFYQRSWEGRDPAEILAELGRECRERQPGVASPADLIAALAHVHRLAQFRGHPRPSREDLLDGVRSVLIKGAEDVEGVLTMALARKLMAGDRVGDVPPEAGQPPIVDDFRHSAAALKIDLDRAEAREVALDIYRKSRAREVSRLFHRLNFLEVPFADRVSGPDFVHGKDLERVQEVWTYHWSPRTESRLIENSLYGSTLEEAATASMLERLVEAEKQGKGRRSDLAAELLLEACRMGLHRHTQDLLDRTHSLVGEDGLFVSLVRTIEMLLVLHVSREPLEAHHLSGLSDLAGAAYDRACYLLPGLVNTGEAEEKQALEALNSLCQAAQTLGDTPERRQLRWERLQDLAQTTGGNAALRGAAVGLLFGDGQLAPPELVAHLRGHLFSVRDNGAEGPRFLRGLMRTTRSALWQVPDVLRSLHELLSEWEEEHFIRQLPNLRLAFADLTPRECDQVAREVATQAGVASLKPVEATKFTSADMLQGAEVNRRVLEGLRRDGLEDFGS